MLHVSKRLGALFGPTKRPIVPNENLRFRAGLFGSLVLPTLDYVNIQLH